MLRAWSAGKDRKETAEEKGGVWMKGSWTEHTTCVARDHPHPQRTRPETQPAQGSWPVPFLPQNRMNKSQDGGLCTRWWKKLQAHWSGFLGEVAFQEGLGELVAY